MDELQVSVNGRLTPASRAAVSVFDAGLLHGASVFTTMLARGGRVFRLDRHLARLMETARMLGLRVQPPADSPPAGAAAVRGDSVGAKSSAESKDQGEAASAALSTAVGEVLRANGLRDARMRITLTPGSMKEPQAGPTTIVTAEPLPASEPHRREKGIGVVASSFRQARGDPAYGYKTGCYLTRMLARQEAARKGADEALWFTHENHLAEACFCNVFLVLGGKVLTPSRDTPALPGIVRQAVLELCGAMGIPSDDRTPLTIRETLAAEEVFLTSSISGVRPVARIEKHSVGDEAPGPLTKRIAQAYEELVARECALP